MHKFGEVWLTSGADADSRLGAVRTQQLDAASVHISGAAARRILQYASWLPAPADAASEFIFDQSITLGFPVQIRFLPCLKPQLTHNRGLPTIGYAVRLLCVLGLLMTAAYAYWRAGEA